MTLVTLFDLIRYEGYTLPELEAAAGGGGGGGSKGGLPGFLAGANPITGSLNPLAGGYDAYKEGGSFMDVAKAGNPMFVGVDTYNVAAEASGNDSLVDSYHDAVNGGDEEEDPAAIITNTSVGGGVPEGSLATYDEDAANKKKLAKARKGTRGLQIPLVSKSTATTA
ncbi:MAG: hypothetical protein J7M03_05475, partial [Candidatus Desulfofervidaceae bacterium]|nr:hypothetical protein [Candidatus Desulfofervidaceae bacterium]